MPYFRDEQFGDYFDIPADPRERLQTAMWLRWCGWEKEANEILYSIAASVEQDEGQETSVTENDQH